LAVVIAIVAAAILGVRFSSADSQTYTGCLSAEGALSHIAIGDSPTKSCGTQTQVSWTSDGPKGEAGAPGHLDQQSCPTGEALNGFDQNGVMVCAAP
jgi:hypothetical protein